MTKRLKNELRNVISGKSEVRHGRIIQTIARYLKESAETGRQVKDIKHFKAQEAKKLKEFAETHGLVVSVNFSQYVSEGAEQRVYLKDSGSVTKVNDAIYYSSWRDYFFNLLLHNYFFPDTAYRFVGFTQEQDTLYAVIDQAFVSITGPTDLDRVMQFMQANGFQKVRNNDYINKDLGIIIEDLHDENVLTKNGILYFIDTVIYVTEDFYN